MSVPLSFETFPAPKKGDTDPPRLILSNNSIVGLYNRAHRGSKQRKNVKKVVKRWFKQQAKQSGWTKVKWYPDFEASRGLAALLIYKDQQTPETEHSVETVEN